MKRAPDIVIVMTDEERAIVPYESDELLRWRRKRLTGRAWFDEHGVAFERHYTGSVACVPSRPTLFTGQYPDVHGVTQTDGLGKMANDSRMRWLAPGEVPTLGHWFRAAGYDTHYDGKWHISHADLHASNGDVVATNTDDGTILPAAVREYLDADPLGAFGFSGWVGPEPHGAALANCGVIRDPLIADRVVAWLADRYARRRAGDTAALRPFLLVASFVNPHDIVLFPDWLRGSPMRGRERDVPHVPAPPTADEDLARKPAAQAAYRDAYYSGYGPAPAIKLAYARNAQRYRELYYRLHAEVDGCIDRVRRTVTEGGSEHAVLVRTSDHGELLGAHGGLHQKWFNLYDEATRVPLVVARIGEQTTTAKRVRRTPTSHVDLLPTLLSIAGLDVDALSRELSRTFTELHPLPGRDLTPLVDGDEANAPARAVYLQTRDNVLEGDSGASGLTRRLHLTAIPYGPLAIAVPADVGANFEAIVVAIDDTEVEGANGQLWKLVRTFDDRATWTEPGVRHLSASRFGIEHFRTTALPDEWELYDLDADPIEARNRWHDDSIAALRAHLCARLEIERARCIRPRNKPWPYAKRRR